MYLELRKPKTNWIFELDQKDSKYYFGEPKLLPIFATLEADSQWITNYSVYYKIHNSSIRDFFDLSYPQFNSLSNEIKSVISKNA